MLFADVDIVKEKDATAGVIDLKIASLNAVSVNALVNFMLFLASGIQAKFHNPENRSRSTTSTAECNVCGH